MNIGCRWLRRHRPLVAGLTAAVVVAGVLGGGGWLWRLHARAVTAEAVDQALSRTQERYDQGDLSESLVHARRADALLEGGGSDDRRARVHTVLADLGMVQRLASSPGRIAPCGYFTSSTGHGASRLTL